jgi:phenylacetate-CoA ligase
MDKLGTAAQTRMIGRFLWERGPGHAFVRPDPLRRMRAIIQCAYDRTEFYRAKLTDAGLTPRDIRTWQDVRHLPLTSKAELLAAGAAAHVRPRIPAAFLSRSSGSSGAYLDVYATSGVWIKDGLIGVDAYHRHVGLRAKDRLLYANTSRYPFTSVGGLTYRVAYFDNLRPAGELAETLISTRPDVLMVYPSIAADLMNSHKAGELPPLKAVITHSEQSSQDFRDLVGRYFGCPVYDEYATEELGRVALQCRYGTYHLVERQSYCEVVDPLTGHQVSGGTAGELVGTNLINSTMPFIRYRQGDLASIESAECECGLPGRALGSLLGRRNDSFQLPNGEELASGRLLDWTYHLILTSRLDIRQFELVQTRHDRVRLTIVPGPSYDRGKDESTIVTSFRTLLTDAVHVRVYEVPSIPATAAGKRILIRSELTDHEREPSFNSIDQTRGQTGVRIEVGKPRVRLHS